MNKGFKYLSKYKQKNICAGFGWMPFAIAAFPMVLDSVTQIISSLKLYGSTKGSVKYRGYESSWEKKSTNPNQKSSSKKIDNKINNHIYAY